MPCVVGKVGQCKQHNPNGQGQTSRPSSSLYLHCTTGTRLLYLQISNHVCSASLQVVEKDPFNSDPEDPELMSEEVR